MNSEEMLSGVRERLDKMTIYEVRQIAREVKAHVTSGQKGTIIDAIMEIARGTVEFAPQSRRGAPPKSDKYDEQLVSEILSLREYFAALDGENREPNVMRVSDSGYEPLSEKEYCGYLEFDGRNYFLQDKEKVFISALFIARYSLRLGDTILLKGAKKNAADLVGASEILTVNGLPADKTIRRNDFSSLTHVYPKTRMVLACGGDISLRMIDLFTPLALGQRVVISAPVNSGKTTLIKSIAHGICANYRDFEVIILTLGARPEEVTELSKSSDGVTLFYTSFEKSEEEHIARANLAFEYAKRRVELNKNAIVLVDGLYENLPTEYIKNFLFCAINAEEGGSLTVVAAMPQEFNFAGVANSVVTLSPLLAAERIFPAIDILKSYSSREEWFLSEEERRLSIALRSRITRGATAEEIIDLFKQTENNAEIAEIIKNG